MIGKIKERVIALLDTKKRMDEVKVKMLFLKASISRDC